MNALASEIAGAPLSLHRGEQQLPFVPYQEGVVFQLLQVDLDAGISMRTARWRRSSTRQRCWRSTGGSAAKADWRRQASSAPDFSRLNSAVVG
jgi:hypothetical protein